MCTNLTSGTTVTRTFTNTFIIFQIAETLKIGTLVSFALAKLSVYFQKSRIVQSSRLTNTTKTSCMVTKRFHLRQFFGLCFGLLMLLNNSSFLCFRKFCSLIMTLFGGQFRLFVALTGFFGVGAGLDNCFGVYSWS